MTNDSLVTALEDWGHVSWVIDGTEYMKEFHESLRKHGLEVVDITQPAKPPEWTEAGLSELCTKCKRPRRDHYPRADWMCPVSGFDRGEFFTSAKAPPVDSIPLTPDGHQARFPIRLNCPACGELHVDRGIWATKPHHTHSCQKCGMTWRPAVEFTVGVDFLPGFKDDDSRAG